VAALKLTPKAKAPAMIVGKKTPINASIIEERGQNKRIHIVSIATWHGNKAYYFVGQ
jgi:hypothetical protein